MNDSWLSFDQARDRALALDRESGTTLGSLRIWVRDLFGRITLYAEGFPADDATRFEAAVALVSAELRVYAGRPPVLRMEDEFLRPLLLSAHGKEPKRRGGVPPVKR